MHRSVTVVALLVAALCLAPRTQAATTWFVTANGEPAALTTKDCTGNLCATLRGAINTAVSGDTIAFNPGVGTITLTEYSNFLTGSEFALRRSSSRPTRR